jgi:putative SOS response-associated peptidase YedK
MCNLYSITKGQRVIEFTRAMRDTTGNLPPMPGVFPDYLAPIVRNAPDGVRELVKARWGMPSSQFALMQATKKRAAKVEAKGKAVDFKELLRLEPDTGTTNIRNISSKHWQRWLGVEHRCVVPFTSFSEFNKAAGGDILLRLRRDAPARLLCRDLDELDLSPQGQGGRDHQRPVRVSDDRAELRRGPDPPEGDAGDLDHTGGD